MATDPIVRLVRTALVTALSSGITGCLPLPIPHMEQVTPAVTGTLRNSDGSPIVGARVAVTHTRKDVACTGRGARGVTDARGQFALPEAKVRSGIVWISLMENFGQTWYWLCAGRDSAASSPGDSLTRPLRTSITGSFRGDTLDCVAWRWHDVDDVACNGSVNQRRLIEGGSWSDGGARGSYRIILGDIDGESYGSRPIVQWIEQRPSPSPGGPTAVVRAQAELPTPHPVSPYGMALRGPDGTWRLTMRSTVPTKWNHDTWFTFELGAPGQFRDVTATNP